MDNDKGLSYGLSKEHGLVLVVSDGLVSLTNDILDPYSVVVARTNQLETGGLQWVAIDLILGDLDGLGQIVGHLSVDVGGSPYLESGNQKV